MTGTTILLQPQLYQPAYNQTILVLDSDNKSESGFNWIVDITIEDVDSSRQVLSANPDGFGVFDLHKHLEPFVDSQVTDQPTAIFTQSEQSFTKYNVNISEEFVFVWDFFDNFSSQVVFGGGNFVGFTGLTNNFFEIGDSVFIAQDAGFTHSEYDGTHTVVSAGTTYIVINNIFEGSTPAEGGEIQLASFSTTTIPQTGATAVMPDKYVINTSLQWLDVPSWDYTDYILTASTGQFLTTLPSSYEVDLSDRISLKILNEVTDEVKYLYVTSDNGVFQFENAFATTANDTKQLSVKIAPWDIINTTDTPVVISGSLPVIDSSTTQYTVQTFDSTSAVTSEIKTFELIDNCGKYEVFKFIFLDRLGSFITVTFNKASRVTTNVARSEYKKNVGSYDPITNTYGYNSFDRGSKQIDSTITERTVINSDWVDESVGSLIGQLIESPEQFLLTEEGQMLPIIITTSTYESKKRVNDTIFNYTIEFKKSFNNVVQRG